MALNAAEKTTLARCLLRLSGEDYYPLGRLARFLNDQTGITGMLAVLNTEIDTWQPYIDAGMDANSRAWFKAQALRIYNGTTTS